MSTAGETIAVVRDESEHVARLICNERLGEVVGDKSGSAATGLEFLVDLTGCHIERVQTGRWRVFVSVVAYTLLLKPRTLLVP